MNDIKERWEHCDQESDSVAILKEIATKTEADYLHILGLDWYDVLNGRWTGQQEHIVLGIMKNINDRAGFSLFTIV